MDKQDSGDFNRLIEWFYEGPQKHDLLRVVGKRFGKGAWRDNAVDLEDMISEHIYNAALSYIAFLEGHKLSDSSLLRIQFFSIFFLRRCKDKMRKDWVRHNKVITMQEVQHADDDRIELEIPVEDLQLIFTTQRLDIEKALNKLPPLMCRVVVMHYIHGMKVEEISETLGISKDYVKVLLFRARQKLRELLEPNYCRKEVQA